jgi:hypothetical protein
MWTILEVEPELASKIQARARERGVSVDVHLRELIDGKELSPKEVMASVPKSEFACCVSGRRVTVQKGRIFLTMQLAARISTRIVINLSQRLQTTPIAL